MQWGQGRPSLSKTCWLEGQVGGLEAGLGRGQGPMTAGSPQRHRAEVGHTC